MYAMKIFRLILKFFYNATTNYIIKIQLFEKLCTEKIVLINICLNISNKYLLNVDMYIYLAQEHLI